MTNREQVAWSFNFSEYDDRDVARIVSDMLDATGIAYMDSSDVERFKKWLGLNCDPRTNNWGVLPEEEDTS